MKQRGGRTIIAIATTNNQTTMKTILLIEHNNDFLENLTEYLEIEGYNILGTNNGKIGLELANKFIPDLIVCDILMPKMDGYEVLRFLSETAQTSLIPFIFSTTMSEKNYLTRALEQGADDYLVKPYELDTLLKKVKHCIQYESRRCNKDLHLSVN